MIRPEKVLMAAPDDAPAADDETCVAPGVVREVVYLGATTHSVVDLEAGATLTVAHQNSDRSIDAALERRDQRVVLDLAARPPGVPGRVHTDPAASPEEETA